MSRLVAKIAVSAATYWLDKPYDYLIPAELAEKAVPGVRVYVPFSRGNRRTEGVLLAVTEDSSFDRPLKAILSVLDEAPVLTPSQLKLAFFMRERFFCTVYDAVRAMLPAGLWFDEEGRRRAHDKTQEMARLLLPPEDAMEAAQAKRLRSPTQSAILEQLAAFEAIPTRELLVHAGAGRSSLKALEKAGLVELYQRETYRRVQIHVGETQPLPTLSEEQERAFSGISALAESGESGAALLFGVTGSGKTSVYIHLIDRQLRRGRGVILLVPEIALTPQMIQTFSSHFGNEVAVLHSSLPVGERYDEWKRVKSGKARVVIGTRSAVFAPCEDLGLLIIDEEQEETYKSENIPRYNARDVAKYRCAKAGCLLLLGSATPELTSMYAAQTGRYGFFRLESRYNEQALPAVEIVDMKRELRRGNGGSISTLLRDQIETNLTRGEQSILFINRRGANRLVSCGECGYTYRCPRCSVSLTYHSVSDRLICHYCGYSRRPDAACPECGGTLRRIGAGTQMVETELKELFPDTQILRMDTDTVTPAGSHEKLLDRFREERIPIMVGTQMVTKGLNFENVTLVGVISADQSLYAGDYRAGERTFSLITQVVGRSGRGAKPGRAVIQTYTPDNEIIVQAAAQDYEAFYASELELRRLQNTPPFSELLAVTVSGENEDHVVRACRALRQRLDELADPSSGAHILGPAPLAVAKVNNRYRYRVMIYAPRAQGIRALVASVVMEACRDKRFGDVSIWADNDPTD
ncbi:MAG: primosomal protein N' [Oscillospiraceae bacterium]|nr:primosomal protein N' [Oscillospiraceae bacterium]